MFRKNGHHFSDKNMLQSSLSKLCVEHLKAKGYLLK